MWRGAVRVGRGPAQRRRQRVKRWAVKPRRRGPVGCRDGFGVLGGGGDSRDAIER